MAKAELKLEYGISALNGGYKTDARRLLEEAVKLDPSNWKAWLWLSRAAEDKEEQESCLEKALELNPENELARRELDELRGPLGRVGEVPRQPMDILAAMLGEQRKQVAALTKLHGQQEQLLSSVTTLESAAKVWFALVALGVILGCIAVLIGNPFGF